MFPALIHLSLFGSINDRQIPPQCSRSRWQYLPWFYYSKDAWMLPKFEQRMKKKMQRRKEDSRLTWSRDLGCLPASDIKGPHSWTIPVHKNSDKDRGKGWNLEGSFSFNVGIMIKVVEHVCSPFISQNNKHFKEIWNSKQRNQNLW